MSYTQHQKASRLAGATLASAALIALSAMAIGLVYSKHESRRLFVELQKLSKARDALNAEWTRLQLEQWTYGAHALIEEKAGAELALQRPTVKDVYLITDQGDFRFYGLEPMNEELAQLLETAAADAEVAP